MTQSMEVVDVWVLSRERQATSLLLFDPSASEADWTCLLELDERGEGTGSVVRRLTSPALVAMTTSGFFSVPVGKRVFLDAPGLTLDVGSKEEGRGEEGDEKGEPLPIPLPKSPEILGETREGFFFPTLHPATFFSPFDSWCLPSSVSVSGLVQVLKKHSTLERLEEHRRYPINTRALGRTKGTFLDEALNVMQSFHELASLKRVPPEMVEWVRLARRCDWVVLEDDWALVSPPEVVSEGWLKGLEVKEGTSEVVWASGRGEGPLTQGFSYRLGSPIWFTVDHASVGAVRERPFGAVAGPPPPSSIPLPLLPPI